MSKKLKGGIYRIDNTKTDMCYIGSGEIVGGRLRDHKNSLKRGKNHNKSLQQAWDKDGSESFTCGILYYCEYNELQGCEQTELNAMGARDYSTEGEALWAMTYNISRHASGRNKHKGLYFAKEQDLLEPAPFWERLYHDINANYERLKSTEAEGKRPAVPPLLQFGTYVYGQALRDARKEGDIVHGLKTSWEMTYKLNAISTGFGYEKGIIDHWLEKDDKEQLDILKRMVVEAMRDPEQNEWLMAEPE